MTAKHPFTIAGRSGAIYGKTADVTGIWTALEPEDTDLDDTLIDVTVSAHSYRRYPGGPLISRAGHERQVMQEKGKAGSNALPGKSFQVIVNPSEGPLQFTYTGPWFLVVAQTLAGAPSALELISNGGRKFTVGSLIS